ncbi:MAG TPA: tubulin-like doman-containing protein [Gemmataceae bacterium]|nr:tubulin-like doman-containing protein [Gemmataceae bacterium]
MAVRIESQAEPLPGYQLIERLGGGGFGEVWKCEAPGGLHKAIKFVFGDLGAAGEDGHRAEQELKALSRVKTVRHPYILSLERYDIIDGQLMIVMELADRNLWDRFKECRARGLPGIPRDELLSYMEETAEALDLMNNEYQLQHLDIKPQNIFLVHSHVKVADFGLVKDLEGMQASVTGGVTPVYAAPETFDGWVSRFCDQYSLGIVYQELLTGQRPFNGNNIRQLILQHLQTAPNVAPLPPSDRPAIARALAKTPGDRFPTCRDLVEALKSGESTAAPVGENTTMPDAGSTLGAVAPSQAAGLSGARGGLTERKQLTHPIDDSEPATECLRSLHRADSNPGTTHFIRSLEGAAAQSGQAGELRQAPPEVNGSGVLFPALVLGLGQLGLNVVQRLRRNLHLRFGGMDRLPHLRLMVLDTDPEVVRTATRGPDGARLSETDVLLAPLNRPSHYLKPRDGRPDVDSWLSSRMLYRIPRSQVTTGVRALGRLAFCDNYRLILRRLQTELNACMNPDGLASALSQTELGLRSNRVRVYVVTSLAGGSGSGMFLDVAYTVRTLLRQAGFTQPDVVGLFLLPSVDHSRTRIQTLGNTCAALRELSYFGRPGTSFTAKYHQREPALQDSDPPFGRCVLLPLPDETDEAATRETVEKAGLFLARDVCSSLGPVADLGRAGLTGTPWEERGLFYQTFELRRVTWPRHELLRTLARRLCHRLVQCWMSKDSKPIRETVRVWVEEQWDKQQLGSNVLMERLVELSQETFGQDPQAVFRDLVEPFLARHASPRKNAEAVFPPEEIAELLEQLEQLLGSPRDDGLTDTPAGLVAALREAADKLVQQWGQKLAELPVRLIESPQLRLAGAEEAIRQMVASIEQALQHHEPLANELSTRAAESYGRLLLLASPLDGPVGPASAGPASAGPASVGPASRRSVRSVRSVRSGVSGVFRKSSSGSRKSLTFAEAEELLRGYPKALYQSLLLRQAGNIFLTLRGHLADEMREINFCRVRLGELLRLLEEPADADIAPAGSATVKHLYPAGCKDFKETLTQLDNQLGSEALDELDTQMEAMLKKQFTALVNVCLTSGNVLKNVEAAMLRTAEELVAARLGAVNVAEMFLMQHEDGSSAVEAIGDLFDEASPQLPHSAAPPSNGGQAAELSVLSAPSGPAGERVRALAAEALPEVEWQTALGDEDIVLYRERANLPLSELPQLGPLAFDAYRQMSAAEHFTPHCRSDIDFHDV